MIVPAILTLAVFLFPGIITFFLKKYTPELCASEKLPLAAAVSLVYWITGFWWLSVIPVPLTMFSAATIGITLGTITYLYLRGYSPAVDKKPSLVQSSTILLFTAVLLTPQLMLMMQQTTPGGQDMSMHTYIAAIIAAANGFPGTLMPLLPITDFGLYPFGFSTVTAVMSGFNNLPVYTNALILSGIAHFLFDYSLYVILRARFSVFISMFAAAIVSWVSVNPHSFIAWGANPSVLSLAFLNFAVAFFLHHKEKHAWLTLLFLYASLLTNYMFVVAAAYILVPFIMFTALRNRGNFRLQLPHVIRTGPAVLAGLPFLIKIFTSGWELSEKTRQYIQTLHWEETSTWTGSFSPMGFMEISRIIGSITDAKLFILFAAAGLLLFRKHRTTILFFGYLTGTVYFLIINARHWWLPLSSLLYPYRISLLLLIPMAWSIGLLLMETQRRSRLLHLVSLLFILFLFAPYFRFTQYLAAAKTNEGATEKSIRAFAWLAARTDTRDIIWNRYDDAGLWIPAVIFRPITLYHTNPVEMDRLRAIKQRYPSYAFRDEVPTPGITIAEDVATQFPEAVNWKFNVAYDDGTSVIYKITR